MPVFGKSITVNANTTKAARNITQIPVSSGILTKCFLSFPWGTARYLHIVILHGETQIIPLTLGESIQLDDKLISLTPNYLIESAPLELKAWCWNDSYRNAHTIDVLFEVHPPQFVFPNQSLEPILTDIRTRQKSLEELITGEVVS